MVLLRFTPAGWREVERIREGLTPKECDTMRMTGTLQKVIEAEHVSVSAIPYTGAWGEIGSARDLAAYQG